MTLQLVLFQRPEWTSLGLRLHIGYSRGTTEANMAVLGTGVFFKLIMTPECVKSPRLLFGQYELVPQ